MTRQSIAEQKSAIVTHSQLKAIDQERIKAHFAGQAIEEVSVLRMEHFASGAQKIWDIKDAPGRAADLQDIIDRAAVSATLRMDSYQQKSADIAAAHIIAVQGYATYEQPELEVKGIIRKRLTG